MSRRKRTAKAMPALKVIGRAEFTGWGRCEWCGRETAAVFTLGRRVRACSQICAEKAEKRIAGSPEALAGKGRGTGRAARPGAIVGHPCASRDACRPGCGCNVETPLKKAGNEP